MATQSQLAQSCSECTPEPWCPVCMRTPDPKPCPSCGEDQLRGFPCDECEDKPKSKARRPKRGRVTTRPMDRYRRRYL